MNFVNFNEHIVETKLNQYGGSERKKTVTLDDGFQYMIKFPDPTREEKRKGEISYINNAISEYIGCHIFQSVGIEVQETMLGIFTDEKGKEKVACACRDIRPEGTQLYETEKLFLELEDDRPITCLDLLKERLSVFSEIDAESTYREYCRRFVIDALIGNTDRHNGNWGFIGDGNKFSIAPVYDCGSSFSPLYPDKELSGKLASHEAMNIMSAVTYRDGRRISYYEFLTSCTNQDICKALSEMLPKISLPAIHKIIEDIPYISDIRKNFYKELVDNRYERVLLPALENVVGIYKSDEYKSWNSKVIGAIYDKYIAPFAEQFAEEQPHEGIINYETFSGESFELPYILNNHIVFFLDDDNACIGFVRTEKSNQNVTKFVQFARNVDIPIDDDIEYLIEQGRRKNNQAGYGYD